MISVVNVTKKFKGVTAVKNLNFNAKEGEIIGFLGPNGAGKTTTMRLLLGYLTPTYGEILIDNLDPTEDRIKVLRKIGYLPENNPLYQDIKVQEYLKFISEVKNANNLQQVIQQVGLSEVVSSRIEELSRGFRQRVGLAAAYLSEPPMLVLDEPTSGLDPIEQDRIKELIIKTSKDKTVLFSTHILSEVEDVATRLIILNRGEIIYDGVKPKGKGAVEKLFKRLIKTNDNIVI